MDPTWLDQLLQYLKGPGLANSAGLNGVARGLNPPQPGSPGNPGAPGTVPPGGYVRTPWGTGVVPQPPRTGGPGVPVGAPYSGQTGVVPSGPATSPIQLPAPVRTGNSLVQQLMKPPQPVQMPGSQPGNPLAIPGGPGGGIPQAAQAAAGLMGRAGPIAALLSALRPQPAQGGPPPPQTGTPVTPTGPLPSAASTFNGNPFGSTVPMPRPAPMPANPPMPPMPPGPPPMAMPGIGGKGAPGAGIVPGVPYAAPGVGGKGTASPDLIQRMIQGLFGSPLAGGYNQQGQNTASGF